MDYRELFIDRLSSTKREGIENVLARLDQLGFFTAPASSRFHLNHEGGLLEHSMNVCNVALDVLEVMIARQPSLADKLPIDSVIIASLLHDTCKADIYRPNIVGATIGRFSPRVPKYMVDHSLFPLGHGEKSVIMLLKWGLQLTDDEIMAIRWHMHAWDLPFQSPDIKSNFQAAKTRCPLLSLIQAADGLASHMLERE